MQLDAGEATTVSTFHPAETLVPGLPAPSPDGALFPEHAVSTR